MVLLIDPDQEVLLSVVPETVKKAELNSNSKLTFDIHVNTFANMVVSLYGEKERYFFNHIQETKCLQCQAGHRL